jgi:hypothetical protein
MSEIAKWGNGPAVVLVGMKSDVQNRVVSYEEGEEIAARYDIPFLECSSLNREHIDDVMATLVYHSLRTTMFLERLTAPPPPVRHGGLPRNERRSNCVIM